MPHPLAMEVDAAKPLALGCEGDGTATESPEAKRRSALQRALKLQEQLQEKARELQREAALEHAEAEERIAAMQSGSVRAQARSRALQSNLAEARGEAAALLRRKEQLGRLVEARLRPGSSPPVGPDCRGSPKSTDRRRPEDDQMVRDALRAFMEGMLMLYAESLQPLRRRLDVLQNRLRKMGDDVSIAMLQREHRRGFDQARLLQADLLEEAQDLCAAFAAAVDAAAAWERLPSKTNAMSTAEEFGTRLPQHVLCSNLMKLREAAVEWHRRRASGSTSSEPAPAEPERDDPVICCLE